MILSFKNFTVFCFVLFFSLKSCMSDNFKITDTKAVAFHISKPGPNNVKMLLKVSIKNKQNSKMDDINKKV